MRSFPLVAVCLTIFTTCMVSPVGTAEAQTQVLEQPAEVADSTIHPEIWPKTNSPIAVDPELEKRIDFLLAKMSLRQKVGQIIQADIGSIKPEDLKKYPLGSILNGGNSAPDGNNRSKPEAWLKLADEFYEATKECELGGGPFIPLLWGTDAVHGHSNVVGATFFPHNIGLGCARNPELLGKIGAITALETRITGLEWTFAPTIAVVRDDRWGRTYEGYSESPDITVSYTGKLIEGIQGKTTDGDFLSGPHLIATAKHFCGDGGTYNGKDQGDNKMSEEQLRDLQAAPYPIAVQHGVQCVMASFSSWQGKKLHGHKGLLTDVLKGRMGFDGFIVGDWEAHGQVEGCTVNDALPALNAGLDMYMAAGSWKGLFDTTLKQAEAGEIEMDRLNDAVRRILRVKIRSGLFDAGKPSSRPMAGQFAELGKSEHRAVARQAVRESLVLLKNNKAVLPLAASSKVLVCGDGADNIGKQSGGWSLSWQGTGNKKEDFPGGTSIYDGIKSQVEGGGGKAILSVDGETNEAYDVAVVVFGEDPYAEFQGDVENLAYSPTDDSDLQLMKRLKASGVPVIGIFISGRPMWINREMNACDAFVAAWLPGSEGVGIADVILRGADGNVQHDFKGKLSYSWPKLPLQTPLNVGDEDYDPLFAFGFGLTYQDKSMIGELSEDPGGLVLASNVESYFQSGKVVEPWAMNLIDGGETVVVDKTSQDSSKGNLVVTSEDDKAQEDIRTLKFKGPAEFRITGPAVDLSRQSNGDMALFMRYRINENAGHDSKLAIEGVGGAMMELPLGQVVASPLGTWQEVSVKLSCYGDAETLKAVTSPVIIKSEGGLSISISDVKIVTNEGQAICLGEKVEK